MKGHGWYSAKMAKSCGYAIYRNSTGEEVKITTVVPLSFTDGQFNPHSEWGDEEYVGMVNSCVRSTFKWAEEDDPSKRPLRKVWKR